jgi:hypothetical protein
MFKNYKDYLKNTIEINNDKPDFYKWILSQNTDMLSYINEASKVIDLFDISSYDNLQLYENVKIINGPIHRQQLIEIMQKENFIFIH